MKTTRLILAALAIAVVPGSYLLFAQAPAGQPAAAPPRQPMSFFVTSVGKGDGANLGGLAGADAHCQALAKAAGQGDAVWRAYLSTQGAGAVNARDRIGDGPWHNFRGQVISVDNGVLHGDTLEQARIGNPLGKQLSLNEKGELVNGVGDKPNQHDILTGSTADGRAYTDSADHTCNNWTSNARGPRRWGTTTSRAAATDPGTRPMRARAAARTIWSRTGGAGLFYCFAVKK